MSDHICPKCGAQHVPPAMVADATHSLKREWGVSLHQVLADIACEAFRHRRGPEIMELLRQTAEDRARDEGLD